MQPTTGLGPSAHSLRHRAARTVWNAVWLLLFRPSPRPLHVWRRALLRLFGARIAAGVRIYPSTRIWAPWNLQMESGSCLGDFVDCYCVAPIHIGREATVSQYSYLCAATHDYEAARMPLVVSPITIGASAWVCADVFVGPGVTVGEGAVLGARAAVCGDVEPWTVVGGNPARVIKRREMRSPAAPSPIP